MTALPFTLIRLAAIHVDRTLRSWRAWESRVQGVAITTHGASDHGHSSKLIIAAHVPLTSLELDPEGRILIPEHPRKRAERAIGIVADVVALAEGCGRSISSPRPCIAIGCDDSDRAWLDGTGGFLVPKRPVNDFEVSAHNVIALAAMEHLADRLDGVSLLAEALSHRHAAGQFRELLRVFERAFSVSSSHLVDSLGAFLSSGIPQFEYSRDEVEWWLMKLRPLANHADRRSGFVVESELQPIVGRVTQAAYDVLFNKLKWRTRGSARRALWIPKAGTNAKGHLWATVRSTTQVEFRIYDQFHVYPIDFSSVLGDLPEGWWTHAAAKDREGTFAQREGDPLA